MLDNLYYTGDDLHMLDITAPLWSEGWENRANARAFCAEIARIREELGERHAAFNAYLNGEDDSEVWDDSDDEDDDDD